MNYFNAFPNIEYKFGNESTTSLMQNIALYTEVVDTIKENISVYQEFVISPGQRPDQLSQALYGRPYYHWTFFLMNDHIRERGWPLTNEQIVDRASKTYPNLTLITRSSMTDKFRVGQPVKSRRGTAVGTIVHRNASLGQITVNIESGAFAENDLVESYTIVDHPLRGLNGLETISTVSFTPELYADHHYVNVSNGSRLITTNEAIEQRLTAGEKYNGEIVDIDPLLGPGSFDIPITNLERFIHSNDQLKQIKIIKPEAIGDVAQSFRKALKSS